MGQQIRIRVERADKMTGEIDFSFIPSEFDVIEKGLKGSGRKDRGRSSYKKEDKRKSGRLGDKRKHSPKDKKKKSKKPFYKEVAKKGAKHGKGRGKGRRAK